MTEQEKLERLKQLMKRKLLHKKRRFNMILKSGHAFGVTAGREIIG